MVSFAFKVLAMGSKDVDYYSLFYLCEVYPLLVVTIRGISSGFRIIDKSS